MNDIPTPDAFAALNALIKLAADPAAARSRIDRSCRSAIDKAAEAEQRLAERSAKHDERLARDREAPRTSEGRARRKGAAIIASGSRSREIIARDSPIGSVAPRPLANGMSITEEQP